MIRIQALTYCGRCDAVVADSKLIGDTMEVRPWPFQSFGRDKQTPYLRPDGWLEKDPDFVIYFAPITAEWIEP